MKGIISLIGLLITGGFIYAAHAPGGGAEEQNGWEMVEAFSTAPAGKAAGGLPDLNFYIGDVPPYDNKEAGTREALHGHIRTSSSGSVVINEEVDPQLIAGEIKEEEEGLGEAIFEVVKKEQESAPFDLQARIEAIKTQKGQPAYTIVNLGDVPDGSGPCVSINREQKESWKKGCCLGSVGLCLIAEYCLYMAMVTV